MVRGLEDILGEGKRRGHIIVISITSEYKVLKLTTRKECIFVYASFTYIHHHTHRGANNWLAALNDFLKHQHISLSAFKGNLILTVFFNWHLRC